MILLATILQATGVAVLAIGLGLMWFPLGVLAVGAGRMAKRKAIIKRD